MSQNDKYFYHHQDQLVKSQHVQQPQQQITDQQNLHQQNKYDQSSNVYDYALTHISQPAPMITSANNYPSVDYSGSNHGQTQYHHHQQQEQHKQQLPGSYPLHSLEAR
jgi:hypothetical protein